MTTFIIAITSFVFVSCGIFGTDDNFKVPVDPDFVCTNSEPGTWTYLGLPETRILSIAINPYNARHILVGTFAHVSDSYDTQGKLFMSIDCGENWEIVWEGGTITEIQFDPKSPNIVYANAQGIIRSTDFGKNWTDRSDGLTEYISFYASVSTFAIDPQQPRRLYAGTAGPDGAGRVFYTDDGGGKWEPVPAQQKSVAGDPLYKDAVAFIMTDPVNPDHVYAGNGPIMRSKDRGVTWETLREVDADIIETVTFSTDYSKIYAMNTRDGFFEFEMPDGPWAFTPYPDSLVGTFVHSIIDTDLVDGILLGTGIGVLRRYNDEYFSMVENLPIAHTTKLNLNNRNLYVALSHVDHLDAPGGIYVRRLE